MSGFMDFLFGDDVQAHPTKTTTNVHSKRVTMEGQNEKKVESSETIKEQFRNLKEVSAIKAEACRELATSLYPLLKRVEAKSLPETTEMCRKVREHIDLIMGLEQSTSVSAASPSPIKKALSDTSILQTKVILTTELKNLETLVLSKLLVSNSNTLEKLNKELDLHREEFDKIVRGLQEPLRTMKDYLVNLKESIDYSNTKSISDAAVEPISLFMVSLDKKRIESFDHQVECQMEGLASGMGIEVQDRIQKFKTKVAEWEVKYDQGVACLLQIDLVRKKIEWKLHQIQVFKEIIPLIAEKKQIILQLEAEIIKKNNLLDIDRENELTGAKTKDEELRNCYAITTRPEIEALHKRLITVIEKLRLFRNNNSENARKNMLGQCTFYYEAQRKICNDLLEESMNTSYKEICSTLNTILVDWDKELRPLNEKVVGLLNEFSSRVITKAGEKRGGVIFASKGMLGLNTKRTSLPNYEGTLEEPVK
jgi:hypothetical protein